FLVDVSYDAAGTCRFFYRLIGTRITYWSGGDATGRYMDDPVCGEGAARLIDLHETVVRTGRPVLTAGEPALFEGSAMRFDRLLLPLNGTGERVDMILGVADGQPAGPHRG
ncbi:MAG TPA: hypothetical protein VE631_03970, partial [Alphaproteobacteria bacterium]|nr:hypothetical protein [Alphaproteobacteria bacterium]